MGKLWDKQGEEKDLSPIILEYTVGEDYLLDRKLLKYEIVSSIAHAKMLQKINIISYEECEKLVKALRDIYNEYKEKEIEIKPEEEDIHTKIEQILVERIGDIGKKLHTGRSRNDQILTVLRLYEKEKIIEIAYGLIELLEVLLVFIGKYKDTPMPGYTHTRQAMPMTVGFWAESLFMAIVEDLELLENTFSFIDKNPLGSSAGYGSPLPIDRTYTTQLLGFQKVLNTALTAQNSRGKYEALILQILSLIIIDFSRFAQDIIILSMDEIGFFKLSSSITTGSSIMPHKRNPDPLEILRAKAKLLISFTNYINQIITSLPTGYSRDLQEIKYPLVKSIEIILITTKVMEEVFRNLEVEEEAIIEKTYKGIFSADIAFELVEKGVPFRDAYKIAWEKIQEEKGDIKELYRKTLSKRVSEGSPGTTDLDVLKNYIKTIKERWERKMKEIERVFKNLLEV